MSEVKCPNCGSVLGEISSDEQKDIDLFLQQTKCNVCDFKTDPPEEKPSELVDDLVKPLEMSLRDVLRRFRANNIKEKINESGKSRLVGDFMANIELWINRISPMEVLTELEKSMELLNSNPETAEELKPYVTSEILKEMLIEVKGLT